ncbi:MAG TPA: DUF4236 domain-containing protein, partial [Bryobacteraceae bacterium]|nr:DUF4236 domain-containing protein [Bryobacteraceae bacterium]
MSWRFRKSFKVIPGVKLNLTTRGLSATIGAAPFSVNVGPRGVYRNVSIPGTGLWNRERIDVPSREHPGVHPSLPDTSPPPIPPSYPVSPAPASEIHSASTEILTSESLEQLRELLTDAYTEQNELTSEIATAESEAKDATRRYERWDRGFIFKNVFKKSFAARREAAETARAKLEELHEQLRLTKIATDINIDHEQAEPYSQMRDKFAILSESKAIWNVLSEQEIDRVAARSHASSEITRTPVSFSLGACDLIDWEQKVPHLPNRTGGDMYMYPGFILYRASKQAFALIDFRDVMLRFVSTQFTERDQIPSDSEIVGFTWAKCNKDGTPDRRFRDNYQIPLAHYGGLLFSTRDGLDVRYLCSNARSADEFVKAWEVFHSSYQCNQEKLSIDSLSHDDLNAISKARQALANLQAAFANFSSLNKTFVEKLVEVAKQHEDEARSEARFSVKEFQAYTSSV